MKARNLRQVDILELTAPYCAKYDVKMNKSDISQYVSGKNEPSQDKLVVLGMALNVSEAWLMGYDVDRKRDDEKSFGEFELFEELLVLTGWSYREFSECDGLAINEFLDDKDKVYCKKGTSMDNCNECELYQSYYYLTNGKVYYKISNQEFEELSYCIKPYLEFRINQLLSKKTGISEQIFNLEEGLIDPDHLNLNAAHERTDIEVTDEMRQHDDDIMNDDDF
jgi:transcriptional regulator with XRE-family HTH domain